MLRQREQSPQQRQQQQPFVSANPDLAQILEGEVGTFEVVQGNQAFTVVCKEGHSITSIIPNGQRLIWIVTPVPNAEPAQYLELEQDMQRRRGNAS